MPDTAPPDTAPPDAAPPETALPRIEPVLAHLDADRDGALTRLFELLRIPSISTDPAHDADCARAAEWLAADLKSLGFDTRIEPTVGKPLVIAHDLSGPGPHVLFYGHYDVQPVDPLALWRRDPFDPAVETRADGSGMIVGRGTSDDKGQVMTFIEACRAFRRAAGTLPCKVTILLEGEEESGGKGLKAFLESAPGELKAEIALVSDTTQWDRETPAITTQLRGTVTEEVTVRAADRDLHSGFYGSAAANPIRVLTRALAGLHDDSGRVTLTGFYDAVPELSDALRADWDNLGFDAAAFLGEVGLSVPAGETDRTVLEQIWARPTAEVNGISGGYTGAGFKTVIPAEATAKVSFRLVGQQDPDAVRESFRAHIRAALPADCEARFTSHGAAGATVMPTAAPPFAAARRALSEEWGREAVFIGAGGSIPVVGAFKAKLGLDTLLIGFGLEDDRIHSPNEKLELTSFAKGARSWVRVLDALAQG
ncbi:MAG: M20/M25/M40 family metallo-hydrolase [Paracoccaceae bacterium]